MDKIDEFMKTKKNETDNMKSPSEMEGVLRDTLMNAKKKRRIKPRYLVIAASFLFALLGSTAFLSQYPFLPSGHPDIITETDEAETKATADNGVESQAPVVDEKFDYLEGYIIQISSQDNNNAEVTVVRDWPVYSSTWPGALRYYVRTNMGDEMREGTLINDGNGNALGVNDLKVGQRVTGRIDKNSAFDESYPEGVHVLEITVHSPVNSGDMLIQEPEAINMAIDYLLSKIEEPKLWFPQEIKYKTESSNWLLHMVDFHDINMRYIVKINANNGDINTVDPAYEDITESPISSKEPVDTNSDNGSHIGKVLIEYRTRFNEDTYNTSIFIQTYEEWMEFLDNYPAGEYSDDSVLHIFNKGYFDNNVIYAYVTTESSGSNRLTAEYVKLDSDDILTLVIKRQVPEVGTADMAGWVCLFGIGRKLSEMVKTVNYEIIEERINDIQ